jgi:hypothetical protein
MTVECYICTPISFETIHLLVDRCVIIECQGHGQELQRAHWPYSNLDTPFYPFVSVSDSGSSKWLFHSRLETSVVHSSLLMSK